MKHNHALIPLVSLLLALLISACGGDTPSSSSQQQASSVTLNVFAAASLTESFKDIQTAYKSKYPNITISYNFAGSQALVQQITQGAQADVFASADQTNMQKASEGNLVNESKIFARNKLVVIIPASNPGNITTLQDLAKDGLKIDVAAPTVPVGKYTLQILDKLGASSEYGPDYAENVKANIVSQEDNVKAVVQKVQLGEVDAGFVYQTDVTSAISEKVKAIAIPDTFNVIAEYPIAVTKETTHAKEAQEFMNYILSADGQATLAKYGFTSIDTNS